VSTSTSEVHIDLHLDKFLYNLTTSLEKLPFVRINVVSGVFGGIGLFLFINFVIVMLAVFSRGHIIAYAWPVEIFLVASFLAIIGWGLQRCELMIPSGIVFGTALILAYCSLSGRWGDWAFLWMTELIFIWLSIFIPVQIRRIPNAGAIWARNFGPAMTILSLFCISITLFLSFLVASYNQLIS
jgi:hypothetical protein